MGEVLTPDAKERIARLEEQQQNSYRLTQQIADNADKTAEALQELVLIHKENTIRSEHDRKNIGRLYTRVENLESGQAKLRKLVWRIIYTGGGSGFILGLLWYSGLLADLINVHNVIP